MSEAGTTTGDVPGPLPDASPPPPESPPPRRRSRRRRAGIWLLLSFVVLLNVAGLGLLALTGAPIRLPVWAVAEIETRINRSLWESVPAGALSVGGIQIAVDKDWVPRLALDDLRLLKPDGEALLTLPETRISFDPAALLEGQIRPRSLRLIGARIDIRRRADGSFDLALGSGRLANPVESFAALFDLVDSAFALPALSHLVRVEAEALTLTLADARAGRVWEVGDGRLRLENRTNEIAAELGLTLVGGGKAPAQAVLTIISDKANPSARITATVDNVAAADIAAQAGPLAWLSVLDAPISGQIATTVGADGISALEGRLDLGPGALRPTEETRPIAFDKATMQIGYDPARGRINLSALEVESRSLRLKASGQSYLQGADGQFLQGPLGGRLPASFLTQFTVTEAMVDPEGLFKEPVRFSAGALDLRLRLNPFAIDIGQLALSDDGHRLTAKGQVSAGAGGWNVGLDVNLNEIRHDRLLALWPVTMVPKTRDWLEQNVLDGTLTDVRAAVRIAPGKEPRLTLGYDFADTDVRFVKTLPPVVKASGYATIEGQTYTVVLSKGQVTPPQGGPIDMAGSVFSVLDILRIPAQAEVSLKTDSSLTAAMSLLDEPPFGFLTKAGRPVDLGQGRAVMEATLRFPLVPKIDVPDISYTVDGRITDFSSSSLVVGKTITAPDLSLHADPRGLTVAGPGAIGRVPFDVTYFQAFGPDAKGAGSIEGTVELSQDVVAEFGLGLPDGMITGAGQGQVTIDLARNTPPRLKLVSDLNRIGVTIPGTGWTKPPDQRGRFEVEATLGKPAVIERIALSGTGLDAEGSITLNAEGGLDVARFSPVLIGDWMRGSVELTGRGPGRVVGVAVTGGTVDLRKMGDLTSGSDGKGTDVPLTVALDRLTVTENIALTSFRGKFTPLGGFNGSFRGAVNGKAPVTGTVVPSANGSAVRIRSDDAGAAMAAAGVFASARGGALDMRLTPRKDGTTYRGVADISRVRVVDAPVLAELLSAVSVVGMLEQLNGEGLLFNDTHGEFIIAPNQITIQRGSATGASLGVSVEGAYGTENGALALQGVVSPIYLLNGIGSALTRRGEGVFGFNFKLTGTADAPVVSVNPLSILTPGMFREIFRGRRPTLDPPAPEGGE